MKNIEFEQLIAEKIIKSLQEEPELWITSIYGLIRKSDEMELNIGIFDSLSIHKPNKYKFENKKIEKQIYKQAKK